MHSRPRSPACSLALPSLSSRRNLARAFRDRFRVNALHRLAITAECVYTGEERRGSETQACEGDWAGLWNGDTHPSQSGRLQVRTHLPARGIKVEQQHLARRNHGGMHTRRSQPIAPTTRRSQRTASGRRGATLGGDRTTLRCSSRRVGASRTTNPRAYRDGPPV